MKTMKTTQTLSTGDKMLKAIIQNDLKAFKAERGQFLRNNRSYKQHHSSLFA
jgi:hypothetical protein